jgi:FAD/FMN-containing dehydrogenase
VNTLLTQFQQITPNGVISNPELKKVFESEWRGRYSHQALAVILPDNVNQIIEVVRLCNHQRIGIVPQGGNTSTTAGAIPIADIPQIIINLQRLNHILDVDTTNSCISVEAGCTLAQVQQHSLELQQLFPLDIGSKNNCQIGGNIATNAGGINVLRYGNMRDLVLGLEVILPNGEVVNQMNMLRKNNTNFDLKQLFIGSEGTLGIITKANLKLFAPHIHQISLLIACDELTTSIELFHQLKSVHTINACEVINCVSQDIYNTYYPNQRFPLSANWLLLVEIASAELNNDITNLLQVYRFVVVTNKNDQELLWQARKNIAVAEKKSGLAIKHDIALPISNIANFVKHNQENIISKYPQAEFIIFGHIGDGNLHYNIKIPNTNLLTNLEYNINQLVYQDVYLYNGTFSAEHGIGAIKKEWLVKYCDPNSYRLMRQIKSLIDPNNIFNPGKIFDSNL